MSRRPRVAKWSTEVVRLARSGLRRCRRFNLLQVRPIRQDASTSFHSHVSACTAGCKALSTPWSSRFITFGRSCAFLANGCNLWRGSIGAPFGFGLSADTIAPTLLGRCNCTAILNEGMGPDATTRGDTTEFCHISVLEHWAGCAYYPSMDDTPTRDITPAGWLEALAESDADLAAGRIVSGDVVMRDLKDSLDRLDAKASAKRLARKDSRRR